MNNSTSQLRSTSTVPYADTGYFHDIVLDYISGKNTLRAFYEHPVSWEGLEAAMQQRDKVPVNREVLVQALQSQYKKNALAGNELVDASIALLKNESTYTVCTAHQPNIFSGYLYFIYKILHAVRLAEELKTRYPSKDFVPVFYMGSEDADLEELGKIFLSGEKLVWDTRQTGAVGRMKPKGLEPLINRIQGELSVLPYGTELVKMLKACYLEAADIQTATFRLVHELFKQYGLVVLIADQPDLKRLMLPVFEDDLFSNKPSGIVTETTTRLSAVYKVQANPREINLFYLEEGIRNRIEKQGTVFQVVDSTLQFTAEELKQELHRHPERFSPNVILRGLYQETILPNIAFIGGGGELAYWLELKDLFHYYKVPYPVQVVRNSFLLLNQQTLAKIERMELEPVDFFRPSEQLLNELVKRDSAVQVHLTSEIRDTDAFYQHLQKLAGRIDTSLVAHVGALQKRTLQQLLELEKKMLRAEKRKFSDQRRQLEAIKASLFPANSLQERVENFLPYYAMYGPAFIEKIYRESTALEQQFIISIL
ncbi:bacillithiol biosynthesis cysteine-adding enzyme BshC [Flavihumibacter sp. CACIAM 22H1]|uniref:bacillithiol biosynthesis cysteine-adding enzyme BshC n=1 Tax=Flavihumibacter sp. CACIAM 22H1 TaxID=1812911 RepID=UPI0007A844AA|nr:bacillithiol biosynthesis cysteine-adding enzyme BshC [Flavihumibacter sp. CACIAM 22H1]KYP14940.1 MAG: bacillithiol biosynthesis cysteine-adding enzyme BshC [Flavihumibacter sp. CACIAM 22H1]